MTQRVIAMLVTMSIFTQVVEKAWFIVALI